MRWMVVMAGCFEIQRVEKRWELEFTYILFWGLNERIVWQRMIELDDCKDPQ